MSTSIGRLMPAPVRSTRVRSKMEAAVGGKRYGLVVVFLLIGALKFTAQEAGGIKPLVAHSP